MTDATIVTSGAGVTGGAVLTDRTLVRGARVFDGERLLPPCAVLFGPRGIDAVADRIEAPDATVVIEVADGREATVLPGLIDAHTHSKPGTLEQALAFGVTTELDMGSDPVWMKPQRMAARTRTDVADIRSSLFGATVDGGWPSGAIGTYFDGPFPVVGGTGDGTAFVADRVADGADYLKLFLEDGAMLGDPVPALGSAMAREVVSAAHEHGLLAVAHVTSSAAARRAVEAGVDGLAHLFVDGPPDGDLIEVLARSGTFVISTLCGLGSMTGDLDGRSVADDARTEGLLEPAWRENLCGHGSSTGPGRLEHAMATAAALHRAGVDVLAGTDAACIGVRGVAHGVSLHHELRLLVAAGLSGTAAIAAATSLPARRFGLVDRGRIRPGARADVLLCEGDPVSAIDQTLSLLAIWRDGHRLDRAAYSEGLARTAAA